MSPIVSIIMGSTSDLPVMEKAAQLLNDLHVPFEMNALSAHRTPEAVEEFAKNARQRGIKVIIAAAGMAAALPGVIAANTTLPVIGVPVKGSALDGVDALYSIIQMPPGIPVATVAINGAMNAAILAVQMLAELCSILLLCVPACRAEPTRDGHRLAKVRPDLFQHIHKRSVNEHRVAAVTAVELVHLEMLRELFVSIFQNGVHSQRDKKSCCSS